ncbi:hypothetical protein H4Q26_004462 [Puccinia striiformis f. sp. tritici PST-130]|nr:hypothetical protein H4Q26_004462 [Puccinia striiformis f. sp. tritici PST-130]
MTPSRTRKAFPRPFHPRRQVAWIRTRKLCCGGRFALRHTSWVAAGGKQLQFLPPILTIRSPIAEQLAHTYTGTGSGRSPSRWEAPNLHRCY